MPLCRPVDFTGKGRYQATIELYWLECSSLQRQLLSKVCTQEFSLPNQTDVIGCAMFDNDKRRRLCRSLIERFLSPRRHKRVILMHVMAVGREGPEVSSDPSPSHFLRQPRLFFFGRRYPPPPPPTPQLKKKIRYLLFITSLLRMIDKGIGGGGGKQSREQSPFFSRDLSTERLATIL